MGVRLEGDGGIVRFHIVDWGKVLELAGEYGWEPAGTEPPNTKAYDKDGNLDHELTAQLTWAPEDWDAGNYHTKHCQRVTDEDAANMADALERALDDIPDLETAKTKEFSEHPLTYDLEHSLAMLRRALAMSPAEFFAGRESKERIRAFIAFCRAGGFLIT